MNLTIEQIKAARDRARVKLARQRSAAAATEAELALWDQQVTELEQPKAPAPRRA